MVIDHPARECYMACTPADKSQPGGTGNALAAARKRRDRIQLSVAYGLILLALWTPLPWQNLVSLAALAWVMLATGDSFDGWSAMGLTGTGFLRSLWVAGAALLLAAAAVLVAARLQTLHVPAYLAQFARRYWAYATWASLQEFLLLDFFLLRLLRLFPGRTAAVLAATGLFTVAHLPNPILTVLTLLWGLASCRLFLHYRNLYTLALAHAILGIGIAITIPGPVVHNMRVGLGYLTYRPNQHLHRSQ
ncbi:MAG: CPBP family intramembrane glutamic endopeptidase [Terracidiphilus sp.]